MSLGKKIHGPLVAASLSVPFLKAIRFFSLGNVIYQIFSDSSWRANCKAGMCAIENHSHETGSAR